MQNEIETGTASAFFERPRTELGARFVKSGNCWPQFPSAPPPAHVAPSWAPTPDERVPRPGGFHWIIPERLAGMQWPGLLGDEDCDLRGRRQLGIRHVVSLPEQPFPPATLAAYGLEGMHFPIVDMGVPERASALALCRRISEWIDGGTPVVLHCKAGLGRIGTLLACVLM